MRSHCHDLVNEVIIAWRLHVPQFYGPCVVCSFNLCWEFWKLEFERLRLPLPTAELEVLAHGFRSSDNQADNHELPTHSFVHVDVEQGLIAFVEARYEHNGNRHQSQRLNLDALVLHDKLEDLVGGGLVQRYYDLNLFFEGIAEADEGARICVHSTVDNLFLVIGWKHTNTRGTVPPTLAGFCLEHDV